MTAHAKIRTSKMAITKLKLRQNMNLWARVHNFSQIILYWYDVLGPENSSVTFTAIISNGLIVIVFTRQVSAADADLSEVTINDMYIY